MCKWRAVSRSPDGYGTLIGAWAGAGRSLLSFKENSMPAYNNAPRATATDPSTNPVANPSLGMQVLMSPFSGPKGSPFDNDVQQDLITGVKTANPNNASTGALNTGIGYGVNVELPSIPGVFNATTGQASSGFDLNDQPGLTMPDGSAPTDARLIAIGGGKNTITKPGSDTDYSRGVSGPVPYVAQPLLAFGNGAARDAGAGPAYTGFGTKLVQTAAAIADGAVLATGWTNRSGATVPNGGYQFGISTTASPAVT